MRRSEAAKYARWSAAVALLLASVTAAVFLERAWVRHVARKNAPTPAPLGVERQSTTISFSKVEENHTIFTVDASKSTDFKGENASLLEDVRITIFGKAGQRHDTLHTKSCRYSKEEGSITCAGEVQIDLLSEADAKFLAQHPEQAAARLMQVETRGVTFERASGLARTDQPVTFHFPNGKGQATGLEYNSGEGALRLERDVRVKLHEELARGGKATQLPQEMEISGSQLDFGRDARRLLLRGPAIAETAQERLTAGEFRMGLDAQFHAKEIEAVPGGAGGRPEMTLHGRGGEQTLKADRISATFSPLGWVEHLDAAGNVQGGFHITSQVGTLSAATARLTLWPSTSQPREVHLDGAVILRTESAQHGGARELRTDAMRVSFSESKKREPSHPMRAETLAPGRITWTENASPGQGSGPVQTMIQAKKLALDFDPSGRAHRLAASGTVQTERSAPGEPLQTATAGEGWVDLLAGGSWSEMQLEGNVRLREGARKAQADRAAFLRAAQTATLTGHASVRDATTETSATKITFAQNSGDMTAEGAVRTVEFSPMTSAVDLARASANIISDALEANSKSGRAVYRGHARLWQGDAVLQGDTIVLQRDARILSAAGNVRGVFQQIPEGPRVSGAARKNPVFWHVSSGTLTYWDKENRAHLENNVTLQAAGERMSGETLDLYFTRSGAGAASTAVGAQQISRAVATGGVVVEQGPRRATAERGEYTAADGKFVMSGGNPAIFDAASGTTTGRQLTFFLTDDTIIVDSENGSRTLTKHRVEK